MSSPDLASRQIVRLDVHGMSCTSCAARVEKKLNKIDGVDASVNYATEKATVEIPRDLDVQRIVDAVAATGYSANVPGDGDDEHHEGLHGAVSMLRRLRVSAVLAVPVLALSMVPAWQFDYWQWVVLALATPIVLWGAYPFHWSAVLNARHGAATMDTLVSIGVGAAYLWSLWALVLGEAGMLGMRMEWRWSAQGSGTNEIYLEVASAVTVFILAGHYLEANAKHQSSAALRALMTRRQDVTVLATASRAIRRRPRVGEEFVVRPGEKIATDGVVVEAAPRVDESMLTGESCRSRWRRRRGDRRHRQPRRPPRRARPPRSARTPGWRRWCAWSRRRSRARPRCSGWPTGSRRVFVPAVIALAVGTFASLARAGGRRPRRSPPRSPC